MTNTPAVKCPVHRVWSEPTRHARKTGCEDHPAGRDRRRRAAEANPSKKAPAAAQLQKSMDSAVDQLHATFASESLADMLPKGKTVKAAARGAAAKTVVRRHAVQAVQLSPYGFR